MKVSHRIGSSPETDGGFYCVETRAWSLVIFLILNGAQPFNKTLEVVSVALNETTEGEGGEIYEGVACT